MYNKERTEQNLITAGLHFCNKGKIWCGAKYKKEDAICNNCEWPKIAKKFEIGGTNGKKISS